MKRYISLLLGILVFIPILAQQSDYYYYYKGERVYLTVDSTRLYVVSEGVLQAEATAARTRMANYDISASIKSNVYNHVVPLQQRRSAVPEVYFSTLEVSEELDGSGYRCLMEQLEAEDNVLQVLPTFSVDGEQVNVTNNFYVKLKSAEDFSLLCNMANQYSIEIIGHHGHMPLWYVLSCNAFSTLNALEAANLFYSSEKFECCEPEFHVAITFHSDDPMFIYQWNLKYTDEVNTYHGVDINVEEAWEITKGDGAIVAVYDEAIYTNHSDLADNILVNEGYDINTGAIPVFDASTNVGHGTNSAGVIAAIQDNGIGLTGVAPESDLISIACGIQVNENTWNKETAYATSGQISVGFTKASAKGADVINCAWSCPTINTGVIDSVLNIVLDKCVVVFAAGNCKEGNSDKDLLYPANSNPRILTVGGITNYGTHLTNDKILGYYSFVGSRYGAALDVVAPAVLIRTTDNPNNNFNNDFYGTSAACAHVSAIAALILSAHPDLTPDQVVSIIEYTARKINPDLYSYQTDSLRPYGKWNEKMGYGLVDAGAAVRIADKASRTAYIRDTVITDVTTHIIDYDVEIENATIAECGMVEIDKEHNVLIKKSFLVEKGGIFRIYESPLPN